MRLPRSRVSVADRTDEDESATLLTTPNGPKADPVELNLWTMIPMPIITRAMLDPEAEAVDQQTDQDAHGGPLLEMVRA